jgi:hypothetical protein
MAERDFGRPTKSRTARSAAASRSPKAILEFAGLPKKNSIMRFEGKL